MIQLLLVSGVLLVLANLVRRSLDDRRGRWLTFALNVGAMFFVAKALFVAWAIPSIVLPEPSGPYTVAVSHWVIETGRDETFTLNPSDERKLHIKVWYPTADVSQLRLIRYRPVPKLAPYSSPGMAPVHASRISSHIASFKPLTFLDPHLKNFLEPRLENAFSEARLSAFEGSAPLRTTNRFPVLLFSHGHRGHLDFYSTTMQDMASHGYIVVAINHSYEVAHSVLPNGEVHVRTDTALEGAPALTEDDYVAYDKQLTDNYAVIAKLTSNSVYEKNENTFFEAYNEIIDTPQDLTQDLEIRVNDMLSVVRFLEQIGTNPNAQDLVKLMDLSKIGAFGMSFGGPTSAEFCRIYGECVAIANMDGKNWGDMLREPLDTPMLWVKGNYTDNQRFDIPYTIEHWQADAYRVFIPNALHRGFTDAPFLSPIGTPHLLEFPHNVRPRGAATRLHRINNDALIAWFNHYAKGEALNLQALEDTYPGVRVQNNGFSERSVEHREPTATEGETLD